MVPPGYVLDRPGDQGTTVGWPTVLRTVDITTLDTAIIGAVTGSVSAAALQNDRSIRLWFRKIRQGVTYRTGRWWTRNWEYIPRSSRFPSYRQVPWWSTGPYWLNAPPPGYTADGRRPKDLLGRPMRPDRAGIVPYSR